MNNASLNRSNWAAVFGLSLTAFVLVASEFMPVSLLTPIAGELNISEGQAGQAIAISGGFALITSLFITSLAGMLNRKTLLLSLTLLMIVSGTVVTFAPNYFIFMMGRALIGIAIGGFWSMSAAIAMRLVSDDQIPRALAIVNGGNALATVIAAPLGSYLGGIIGWRGAFFFIVPVAAIAFVWLFLKLPKLKAVTGSHSGNILKLLKEPPVAFGMAAASFFFMGQFTLFTYLRPFLETITKAGVTSISFILLVLGLAGLLGTIVIGNLLKNRLYRTLIVIPLLMSLIAIGLIEFGHSMIATTVLLGLWGLLATSAPVAWWTWVAKALPKDAEAGGGLMVALVQLSIMLGAVVGGLLYDVRGYQATFAMSVIFLLASASFGVVTARIQAGLTQAKVVAN
ncbi:MFS transporter [Methylovorus sp. MM2]|uniref:MFS transporter n=1 Tax=Methylovorus sp. MM2 TaxID=1848038 RepID=UPI000A5BC077|nr:MFS transporter [Methylovorus sp. MM2]